MKRILLICGFLVGCAQFPGGTDTSSELALSDQNRLLLDHLSENARKDVVFIDANNSIISKQFTSIDWVQQKSRGLPREGFEIRDGGIVPLWAAGDNDCNNGKETGFFFRDRFLSTAQTPINWMTATLYLPTGAVNEGVNNKDTSAQAGGFLYSRPTDDPFSEARTDGPFFYIGLWSSNTNADAYAVDAGFQMSTGTYKGNTTTDPSVPDKFGKQQLKAFQESLPWLPEQF